MNPESVGARFFPLCLLLLGHVIADYLCQSAACTRLKREGDRHIVFHALKVWLVTATLLTPYFSPAAVGAALAIAVGHFLIDRVKIAREKKAGPGVAPFRLNVLDQLGHLALIAVVWRATLADRPWPLNFQAGAFFWGYLLLLAAVSAGVKLRYVFAGPASMEVPR